jgi:hypothetical protein
MNTGSGHFWQYKLSDPAASITKNYRKTTVSLTAEPLASTLTLEFSGGVMYVEIPMCWKYGTECGTAKWARGIDGTKLAQGRTCTQRGAEDVLVAHFETRSEHHCLLTDSWNISIKNMFALQSHFIFIQPS